MGQPGNEEKAKTQFSASLDMAKSNHQSTATEQGFKPEVISQAVPAFGSY